MLSDGTDKVKAIIDCSKGVEKVQNIKKEDEFKVMVHQCKSYEWYKKKVIELIDWTIIN